MKDHEETVAQDISNEAYKTLRTLLVIAATLGGLVMVLVLGRVFATHTMTVAAEEYAVQALMNTKLTEPLDLEFSTTGFGVGKLTLIPTDRKFPVPLSYAIEAAADLLMRRGVVPVAIKAKFDGASKDESISATFSVAEPADWVLKDLREILRGNNGGVVTEDARASQLRQERETTVLALCPNKFLPVEIKATFGLVRIGDKKPERLTMGQPVWRKWSAFARVPEQGMPRLLVPVVNTSSMSVLVINQADTGAAWSNLPLDCANEYHRAIGISWTAQPKEESSYLYYRNFLVTSPDLANQLNDAIDTLQNAKITTTNDHHLSMIGGVAALPLAALILSAFISLQIRNIASLGDETVHRAMWGRSDKQSISKFDGRFIRALESGARGFFIVFALLSLLLAPLAAMYALWYPIYANNYDVSQWEILWGFMKTTVPGWLTPILLWLFVHQVSVLFNIRRLR